MKIIHEYGNGEVNICNEQSLYIIEDRFDELDGNYASKLVAKTYTPQKATGDRYSVILKEINNPDKYLIGVSVVLFKSYSREKVESIKAELHNAFLNGDKEFFIPKE